ncbi:hypothetical protein BDR04DRAFT_1102456 [Suillus decipiens]|nr:hypothetical protein BDR04DRAFT_1102456 [Suillus decipiens]
MIHPFSDADAPTSCKVKSNQVTYNLLPHLSNPCTGDDSHCNYLVLNIAIAFAITYITEYDMTFQ